MDKDIWIGGIVGLIFATSLYVWNSESFSKNQKVYLLCCVVFAPIQWISILLILAFNNYRIENSPEKTAEKTIEEVKTKLDSTIENLKDLKLKGILTEQEYTEKVQKLEVEKASLDLKNSKEYKQLKNLFDSGVLTKEELEIKVNSLKEIHKNIINVDKVLKVNSETNKDYIQNDKVKNEVSESEIWKYMLKVILITIGIISLLCVIFL
jgi:hypothetical protein